MLTKLWSALEGYKTYVIAGISVAVALVGHFWGPINIGNQQIPVYSWPDVWNVLKISGLFSALHAKKGA